MLLYRYEFVRDNESIGILVGLDDFFNDDEILSVCGIFEIKLDIPSVDMSNTKSYFTEKGNRKFRKGIRKIKGIADKKGIKVVCEVKEKNELREIVYEDDYQVIVRYAYVA